ncbi:hypothetical protein E2C01_062288 [Portunus trituberculatus]|uniref:Uncharacterized protein n=1 Tax=Portunus trituberculatus TaxID=210409 RepID=A0A5B7HDM7_PORTR|nr:hypothetical protein [Portunus trituberculatus]
MRVCTGRDFLPPDGCVHETSAKPSPVKHPIGQPKCIGLSPHLPSAHHDHHVYHGQAPARVWAGERSLVTSLPRCQAACVFPEAVDTSTVTLPDLRD